MFELALPWVLIALPVPLLIWFCAPKMPLHLSVALKVPFFKAIAAIVDNEKHDAVHAVKTSLLFFVWSLLLLALSGPRWVGEPQPLSREGYNIMLALDISGSMDVEDRMLNGRPATRLTVVKRAGAQFVQDRVGDRIGLILFGTRAYLQTPLTYDHHTVLMRIEDASVGLAGNSTSIGDALGLAVKRLEHVPAKGRVIILLTDGVNNSGVLAPLKAAEIAREDGIKVYTIGLGSETSAPAFGGVFLNMPNVMADLDEDTLKAVAKMTGGRYYRATDMQSLQTIYANINQIETIKQEQATVRPQHDYYPWPLGFALLLFLYWLLDRSGVIYELKARLRPEVSS